MRALDARLAALVDRVADLVPQAFAPRPHDPERRVRLDPAWRRAPGRYVFARPDCHDHWECAAMGEPWMYVDVGPPERVGLRLDGEEGLRRAALLLEPRHAKRLEAFLEAAARFEDPAATALLATRPTAVPAERVLEARTVPTATLVRSLILELAQTGLDARSTGRLRADEVPALRVVETDIGSGDPVALRRAVLRVVALWRPLFGLNESGPPPGRDELERRVRAAYRTSLRLIAGSLPAAERGALRAEVRRLVAAYRTAGRTRPRVLEVLMQRLDVA